jgi:hypothetical protein
LPEEDAMKRTSSALVVLLLAVSGFGCSIVKGMTQREARNTHAESLGSCPVKSVKTEVVREVEPPEGIEYQAVVRATGCGQTKLYMCTAAVPNPVSYYHCTPEGS